MKHLIPKSWVSGLNPVMDSPRFLGLSRFLNEEAQNGKTIFPAEQNIFRALASVSPMETRVVILGQDPYHGDHQALGLSFGVPNTLKPKPPSLRNIFKEIESDLGVKLPEGQSDLTGWASQGVLLLNTVLTVRAHEPLSHQNRGWEEFTDQALRHLDQQDQKIIFVLWGGHAQKKKTLIQNERHEIMETAHPSPLSAYRGFLGSKIFSKINQRLVATGGQPINWSQITEP